MVIVPMGKSLFAFLEKCKILKGERGKPIYWWMLFELTLLFLSWAGAVNRSFPLSPPPNHTPLCLLPLAHGPTMSYIGWVQAGGAWALPVLPFQICPRVCLLLMCLPQPGDPPSVFPGFFMRAFLWSFTPIRSWASYDNGLYISLAHLWFSLLPAALARN